MVEKNNTPKAIAKIKINPIKKVEEQNDKIGQNLFEIFYNVEKEDLKVIVKHLELTERAVIYSKHGDGLDKCKKIDNEKRYSLALYSIEVLLFDYHTKLYDTLKISKYDLEVRMTNLTEEEQTLIYKIHGQNFEKTMPAKKILTLQELKKYERIIKKLSTVKQKQLNNKDEVAKNSIQDKYKYIQNRSLIGLVELLNQKQKEAIYLKYGKNLRENYGHNIDETDKKYIDLKNGLFNLDSNIYILSIPIMSIFEDIKYENLITVIEELEEEYKNVVKKHNGEKLDITPDLNLLTIEEAKLYLKAITKIQNLLNKMKNFQDDRSSSVYLEKSLTEIYNYISFPLLKFIVELLPLSMKEVVYSVYSFTLDSIVTKPETLNADQFNLLKNAINKIDKLVKIYVGIEDEYRMKQQKIKPENKKKEKNKTKTINKLTGDLEILRIELYDKFKNIYANYIDEKELNNLIINALLNYDKEEGLNIKLSSEYKINNGIIKLLSDIYAENLDNEYGMEILMHIISIYAPKFQKKYPHLPISIIEKTIEDCFVSYDQSKTFNIITEIHLKKIK